MEQKVDQLVKLVAAQQARLTEIDTTLRRQSDTANRRCDALYKTMSQGFQALNYRLDQHELVFETWQDHLDQSGGTPQPA